MVHQRQIFSSFLRLVLGMGVIMAPRLSIPTFVYGIVVKAISSKDEVER